MACQFITKCRAVPKLSNKRLEAALDKYDDEIEKAFLSAIYTHGTSINLISLIEALERGDIDAAVNIAAIPKTALYPVDASITNAYITGGQMIEPPKFAANFGFDGRNPRAQQWSANNAGRLVVEISSDQRTGIRTVISENITKGPRQTALMVTGRMNPSTKRREGGVVGLNSHQMKTVMNVRDDLETLSPNYFTRTLRDKRFDPMVKKAIADGKPLSAVDVDRITGRYADRSLNHRGKVIARTESINALRAGRREGVIQAVEQGAVSSERITRRWSATLDKRTRPDHAQIDRQEVEGMDTPFTFPDGTQAMFPGDGSLGAGSDQTTACRCYDEYRVDWLRA